MTAPAFFERYKQLMSLEQSKDNLIEELLQRVTDLEDAYQREKLDHERETRFNRDIQIHEMELMDQISRIKTIMDREPFVIVLLDGDGLIFMDDFLQQGEQGGQNAATQLSTALEDYISSNFPSITTPKIMTKIYANVKGLSDLCVKGGIINEPTLLDDFVRGFNGTVPLFDLVDIGAGNDKAHDKIGEVFQVYLYNCHCHQIFLGCSNDSEYAEILEDTLEDRDLIGRVSLIEGIPFEKDLEFLKSSYRVTKFPKIFRNTKIAPLWAPWKAAVTTKPRDLLTPSPNQHVASLSRTSTNTTSTTSSVPLSSTSPNASNSGDFQVVRSKTSIAAPPKTVERNRYGQRVDRLDFRSIPRDELNRIKKLKLCNFYFLQGECPNDNCHHDHSRKLSKSEYHILTAIARMTPCRFGLDCDDPECMYGHRCPQSEPGKKDCYWGSNCRFDTVAHGIDTNIVKLTKV
ncbi:hypothetical protein ASPWEDRAFT_39231 [Aspergillus wentii DTO 134E9]|uniref:C3H1-type domain-containing protein n=1 Tax=Aspergillus wentii DTO 134E9 TaxID=1073089 RepID=A0A1L9RRJ5_ASPWE|nr:uncharacterized protein ASPWEDRAFT_39231 [Aspergillus wentii DTO 134E9]OJJ37532.1 hypothetical protein ASPWEDRAFT_39231 [Aspergillus wentii DTO 134E9]